MSGIIAAGTHSGCGKTTVVMGLLAALKKKRITVQSFKAGPDFIDSGLHRLITGRPSRNLDLWMCGRDYVRDCYGKNSADADISIVEGVMGLYDGDLSTAALATALDLPVVLVIDAYGMAESAGAVVKGFVDWGAGIGNNTNTHHPMPTTCFAGVILNRVASENHYRRLKNSITNIPVLGYLPRDLDFAIPHRHLGLATAEENPIAKENIGKLADTVLKYIDMEHLLQSAAIGPVLSFPRAETLSAASEEGLQIPKHRGQASRDDNKAKIAIARDRAFCFYYEDNLDLLRESGAELAFFSPLDDTKLPDNINGIYLGGGYPELHAEQLSQNTSMLRSIRDWSESDGAIYAECGGLMYLSAGLRNFEKKFFSMAGVFPFETEMRKGRANLGYREVSLKADCILGAAGETLRGHEFHYSVIRSHPSLSENSLEYKIKDGAGNRLPDEGYSRGKTVASYIHIHFGSNPSSGRNFINFIRNER